MNITHCSFHAILLAICLFSGAGPAFAQGTNLSAIRGTVTDANGGLISGAKAQITDIETGLTRQATTSSEGAYEVTGLKYGVYRVTVSAQGFKTASINQVALRGGDTVRADVVLQRGGPSERVGRAAV